MALNHSCKAILGVIAMFGFLAAVSPDAHAQRSDSAPPPSIDAATGKTMNEAIELLNMDDLTGARAKLGTLKMDRLSPYERSRVEQMLFQISYQEEKYEEGRQHLMNAISAGGLNESEVLQNRYYVAQLYMQEENWVKGAEALEEWFKAAPEPNSAAYYMLAIAYYQQNEIDKALAPAKKAVELTDKPQSAWIDLLVFLYIDQENYKAALPLLEKATAMEPKKRNNWMQLSSIYQQLEMYPEALASMQLAYEAGLLTQDSDFRRLADMLAFNEVPYRCAQVLEAGLKDMTVKADADAYQKLANCWIAAREFDKSLDPLEEAAAASDDGDLYVRLAEVNMQREAWDAVIAAARKAIDKGKLKDPGYPQLLTGIALYNDKKLEDARQWFERAQKSDKHRKLAGAYMQRIKSELNQKTGG